MQCSHCQTENRTGRRFCAECGAPLALPCVSCGFANESGEKFCGSCGMSLTTAPHTPEPRVPPPQAYTPSHLTDKILAARPALTGERKQVTVLFADLKDSTELIRGLDPEAAQQLLDPPIHHMMDAVHRFEGTVNQVLGDGIMALVGTPGAYRLAAPLQGMPVPATVQAVLAARIDRLAPEEKGLLQTAVVLGTDVPLWRCIAPWR